MNTVLSLQDPEATRRYYEAGHWRPETMYMVLRRHAEASPDKFALRDSVDRLTYGEVLAWVDALAEDLHGAGVRPGQRLSVWLPSRAESVIILLACSRMGYIANTSLHRDYTCDDVVALVERARSAALFAEPGYGTDAEHNDIFEAAASRKGLRKVYRLEPLEARTGQGGEAPRFGGLRPAKGSSPPSPPTPTASSTWRSRRGPRACPRASCTATTRYSPMAAPSPRTGGWMAPRFSTRSAP